MKFQKGQQVLVTNPGKDLPATIVEVRAPDAPDEIYLVQIEKRYYRSADLEADDNEG